MRRGMPMNRKNGHRIKYPKLLLLLFTVMIAIAIFYEGSNYAPFHEFLASLGYLGAFLAGMLYAYGFTASPATAVLLVLSKGQNTLLAALIGGAGALLSDLVIFFFIRRSFMDEIRKLEKEKAVQYIEMEEKAIFGDYRKYILPAFAGFVIASPLPSEIGIALLASIRRISVWKFMLIAYILHTLGIFAILAVGKII
jgi:uncharacterized membrane protein YdjX (TVP38/TMEM64 family)